MSIRRPCLPGPERNATARLTPRSVADDLVDAYLAGYQVNYLSGYAHYRRGWHATSTVGTEALDGVVLAALPTLTRELLTPV